MKPQPHPSPFVVPTRVKIEYAFRRMQRLVETVKITLYVATVSLGLILIYVIFPSAFQNAVVVGLIGVVAGALIAGGVSVQLSSQQLRINTLIAKKNEIYKPLYDALRKLNEQLVESPYPLDISTEPHSLTLIPEAKFLKWTKIKTSSDFLRVPKWIANALNTFIDDIYAYQRFVLEAAKSVHVALEKILVNSSDPGYTPSSEFSQLQCILRNDLNGFQRILGPYNKAITEENWLEIKEHCSKLESIKKITIFYQSSLLSHLDWLLQEIGRIIQYVETTYEMQREQL